MKKFLSRFLPLTKIESVAKRRVVMIAMLPILIVHPFLQNIRMTYLATVHTVKYWFLNPYHHAVSFCRCWTYKVEKLPSAAEVETKKLAEEALHAVGLERAQDTRTQQQATPAPTSTEVSQKP